MIHEAGIALGSNLGYSYSEIENACAFLSSLSSDHSLLSSPLYRTSPVDCAPGSPDYLNSVVVIQTGLPPEELLSAFKKYEQGRGRLLDSATGPVNAPRPIDLDILYYGQLVYHSDTLTIPHPRLHLRRFVLEPLSDLRPTLTLPGFDSDIQTLCHSLDSSEPPLTKLPTTC